MSNSRAAIRYAKAILDIAVDQKATKAVEADMRAIVETVAGSTEMQQMLASPVVKAADKKAVLIAVFKNNHAISQGLTDILVSNKRIDLLAEVAEKFIVLNEALKGEGIAYVTTAVPLTAALESTLLKKVESMTGNKVVLENKVDESIVGGFILRVGDLQYDASIANKLSNLKREFATSL